MKTLEAICFFGIIAAWVAAENIPLCAVLLVISFAAGIIAGNIRERKARRRNRR
jgi:hypothetical protein